MLALIRESVLRAGLGRTSRQFHWAQGEVGNAEKAGAVGTAPTRQVTSKSCVAFHCTRVAAG